MHRFLVSVPVLFFSLQLMADGIYLVNGSMVKGEIESLKDNFLLMNTGYGVIKVPLKDISRIESDKSVWLRTQGADFFSQSGPLSEIYPWVLAGENDTGVPIESLSLTDPNDNPWCFSGNANVYFAIDRGNDHKDNLNSDGHLTIRNHVNRHCFDFKGEREHDKEKATKDRLLGKYCYSRFFTPGWYGFGSTSWEKNKIQLLDSRSIIGLGLGHQFRDSPEFNLKADVGVSQIWEKFSDPDEKRENQALSWSLHYDQLFWQKMTLFHDQGLYRRLKTTSWLLQTATGIRYKLTDLLHMSLRYEFDHDDDPQPGRKKEDSSLLFGLGASW